MTEVGPGKEASVDGFRDPVAVRHLAAAIGSLEPGHEVRIMHICGTHENALCQSGLRDLLPAWVKLLAGPGCPVCVCPPAEIDMAVRLAVANRALVATFGDVVRVPARMTLLDANAAGGDCRVVYGIDDAIKIALSDPDRQVVFFAVGFETTSCTTAAALKRGVPGNFSVLCSHRLIPPALRVLLASQTEALHGFMLPGHVSTVIGLEDYCASIRTQRIGMAVAGFEPVDMLLAIHYLVKRAVDGDRLPANPIHNAYSRAVRDQGNPTARQLMAEVFEECDASWRGIGMIPQSGYRLRDRFAAQDAARRFDIAPDISIPDTHPGCRCGEVLLGRVEPEECPLFRTACDPDNPIGPCMVAFEGTCHARFRHRQPARLQSEQEHAAG